MWGKSLGFTKRFNWGGRIIFLSLRERSPKEKFLLNRTKKGALNHGNPRGTTFSMKKSDTIFNEMSKGSALTRRGNQNTKEGGGEKTEGVSLSMGRVKNPYFSRMPGAVSSSCREKFRVLERHEHERGPRRSKNYQGMDLYEGGLWFNPRPNKEKD